MRYKSLVAISAFMGFVFFAGPIGAQDWVRTDTLIPMRDGVHLFTVIVVPPGAAGPLPILMTRTPYGASGEAGMARRAPELGLGGYIAVFQDIRGRFGSQGTFEMNRPPRSGHAGSDESTDTYDTIDWLVKHVPNNNGRVGILGVSYPGWLTAVAGIGAHPALKAISPQAPMGDAWMGDDFFHQGAFRLSYGLEYAWMMEASSDLSVTPAPARYDTFEWYLSFPTLGALSRAVGADAWPTWRRFVEHPAYDTAWQARSLPRYFTHTTVPTLTVGGWWDQEDEYGPLESYKSLERTDTAGINHLVMGPWYHGQWFADSGVALGNIRFGRATGVDYRALRRSGSRTGSRARATETSPKRRCSTPGRTRGASSTVGRRVTPSGAGCTSTPTACCRSQLPPLPLGATSTPPIRRIRSRTGRGPWSARTRRRHAGVAGRRRISVSSTAGPMCSPGRRRRSRRT